MLPKYFTVISLISLIYGEQFGYRSFPNLLGSIYHAEPRANQQDVVSQDFSYQNVHQEYPGKYNFGYSVHDDKTGDLKSHHETRDGDIVRGRYEVIQPDGYKQIVEYTADAENGFKAIVSRIPIYVNNRSPVAQSLVRDIHRPSYYPNKSPTQKVINPFQQYSNQQPTYLKYSRDQAPHFTNPIVYYH